MHNNKGAIKCQNLSFSVADKTLLKCLSCEFPVQKISVILGQNGAGKSTLIKCLSKQLIPTSGWVEFNQQPLQEFSVAQLAKQRAVLSQNSHLSFSMPVNDFIRLGFQVRDELAKSQADEMLSQLLQHFDLQQLHERDVLTLSGGETQRVQLARVLAQIWPVELNHKQAFENKWLFLDEWTTGLDLHHQQQLVLLLQDLVSQGLSIVMVVHDLNLAAQVADEVIFLKNGTCIQQGTAQQTLTAALIKEVLQLEVSLQKRLENKYPLFLK